MEKNEVTLRKITAKTKPTKLTYNVGGKVDTPGLELQIVNDNNLTSIKDGYSLSIASGNVLNKVGMHKIIVTYQSQKFEFDIVVKKVSKIEVDESKIDTEYKVGEKFDEDITITVEYSDGTKEEIKDNFIVSKEEFNSAGENSVSVSYGDATTNVIVNVVEEENEKTPQNEHTPETNENDTKSNNEGMEFGIVHIILLIIISIALTAIFEYKKEH